MTQLTKAQTPLVLTDAQGKTYEMVFKDLTDQQIDTLDQWLRVEYINSVRHSLRADDVTSEEREFEMALAQETAMSLSWMSGRGAAMMASPRGMARLVWEHCRESLGDLKFEDLKAMMFNPKNVLNANAIIALANQHEADLTAELDSGGDAPAKKRKARKKTPRRKA